MWALNLKEPPGAMDSINPKSICIRWPSESINKLPEDIVVYVDSDNIDDDDCNVDIYDDDDSITIMSIFYEQQIAE